MTASFGSGEIPSEHAALDAVNYIQSMAKELRGIASRSNEPFLAYLIGMVEEEANSIAKRNSGRDTAKG